MVAMGDGSVRLFPNTINPALHRALHSGDGGDVAGEF
jgi:hypothetical protein